MRKNINEVKHAENEAEIFLKHALAISNAFSSSDEVAILTALDNNLKLWVEIETSLKDVKNLLPEDIKENLLKLSKFVERLTLSKGLHMTAPDYNCLININMQISEGLLEAVRNHLAKEEAFSLLKCALDISTARDNEDKNGLVAALDNNMKLWVYIKTLANSEENKMPKETKNNLIKLADYVSAKTLEVGQDIDNLNQKAIDSMIMTNLQISEGLMNKKSA
ncbi:MAG: flagellar biosynthesis regulator FlaF [Alphaproteobacteria bacterium]|nr:flagellar biosynthesis regulator FlaF [Alphaproteobacteria bacterium]